MFNSVRITNWNFSTVWFRQDHKLQFWYIKILYFDETENYFDEYIPYILLKVPIEVTFLFWLGDMYTSVRWGYFETDGNGTAIGRPSGDNPTDFNS